MKVNISQSFDVKQLHLSKLEEKLMDTCYRFSSQVWTGVIDGGVACVWGVIPPSLLSDQAYLWLYTTSLIKDHQFVFVRHSQIVVEKLLKEYKIITGHCAVDAEHSIRWLKWLGATFDRPEGKKIPFRIGKK